MTTQCALYIKKQGKIMCIPSILVSAVDVIPHSQKDQMVIFTIFVFMFLIIMFHPDLLAHWSLFV